MVTQLWYKNAIVYSLDVETFMDGNDDGIGDFVGLTRRLGYLAGLGVNCLWLMPFYPSPNHDDGYDVSDYYDVDSRLGDLGDFVEFSHSARQHGIRIIIDLVANHTSREHPWFQAALQNPGSRYRDYYIWSKTEPSNAKEGRIFPGEQRSTWTYEPRVESYYYHRFFSSQPDLNVSNPEVRREILKVMGFWLELGVSGFRVDAVPFLIEPSPVEKSQEPHQFEFLREMREFLSWRRGDAVLLGEVNVPFSKVEEYFGDGTRLQLVFNFLANQNLFLSLVDETAAPMFQVLDEMPELYPTCQWANFVRNHDELDLGRLSEEERARIFQALGPEKCMQLYERGLRRRLAPMLNGDRRRIELLQSLMLSLPGTPVLYYGEELGMGDDLSQPSRQSVRTPMQWSSEPHGGFTRADSSVRSSVHEGPYAFQKVNVAAQRRNPDSLLNWMERVIRLRKESPELGSGKWKRFETGSERVLGIRYEWEAHAVLVLHNLSKETQELRLEDVCGTSGPLINLLSGDNVSIGEDGCYRLSLEGYGYRWFRLGEHDPGHSGVPPRS